MARRRRPRRIGFRRSSANRGVLLGEVRAVRGDRGERVVVRLVRPVRRGDGIVFEGDRDLGQEVGGRVYEIFADRRSVQEADSGATVDLTFQHGLVARVKSGRARKSGRPTIRN